LKVKDKKMELTQFKLSSSSEPTDYGFVVDDKYITFDWGYKGYWIALDRIETPQHLLALVAHLGAKNWSEMTPNRIAALIRKIQQLRGWSPIF